MNDGWLVAVLHDPTRTSTPTLQELSLATGGKRRSPGVISGDSMHHVLVALFRITGTGRQIVLHTGECCCANANRSSSSSSPQSALMFIFIRIC